MRNGNGRTRPLPTDSGFPVALYARVSTTQQDPEVQLHELRSLAAAKGWTITREYVDAGISGASTSRPELSRLLADAHRGCFARHPRLEAGPPGKEPAASCHGRGGPPRPGDRCHLCHRAAHGLHYPDRPSAPQYLRFRGGVRAGDDPGARDSGFAKGEGQRETHRAAPDGPQSSANRTTPRRGYELAWDRPKNEFPGGHRLSVSGLGSKPDCDSGPLRASSRPLSHRYRPCEGCFYFSRKWGKWTRG